MDYGLGALEDADVFGSGKFFGDVRSFANENLGRGIVTRGELSALFLGSKLTTQGTQLELTIFHDDQIPGRTTTGTNYVRNRVTELLSKYFIGDFSDLITDESSKLHGLIGFQDPPNGYNVTFNDLGSEGPDGTFTLYIGKLYKVPKLKVDNVSLTFSKHKVKYKDKNIDTSDPLYAKIKITLSPAVRYTTQELSDMIKQ